MAQGYKEREPNKYSEEMGIQITIWACPGSDVHWEWTPKTNSPDKQRHEGGKVQGLSDDWKINPSVLCGQVKAKCNTGKLGWVQIVEPAQFMDAKLRV